MCAATHTHTHTHTHLTGESLSRVGAFLLVDGLKTSDQELLILSFLEREGDERGEREGRERRERGEREEMFSWCLW